MRENGSGDWRRLAAAALILLLTVTMAARAAGKARRMGGTVEALTLREEQERTPTERDDDPAPSEGVADSTGEHADLTVTPADIAAMEQAFAEEHPAEEGEDGVREEFFVTDHATDIIGDVAIRNTTETQSPDFAALLEEGAPLTVADAAAPTVLVFHTHTTESYALNGDGLYYPDQPTHRRNSDRNMVRVGDELCAVLAGRGVGYIHDTEIYDDEYDGAYARSREAALRYLEEYPTLKIVIDVHRDAFRDGGKHVKPTAVINGKKAAQVMIIAGAEENGIEYPGWETNLRFALALQKAAQSKYMGLMKPLFFCPRRYNMDLTENGALLEIGTEVNTLEEAAYAARLIGDVIADCVLAAGE